MARKRKGGEEGKEGGGEPRKEDLAEERGSDRLGECVDDIIWPILSESCLLLFGFEWAFEVSNLLVFLVRFPCKDFRGRRTKKIYYSIFSIQVMGKSNIRNHVNNVIEFN